MSIGGFIKSALGMNDEVADVLDVPERPERPVESTPESEGGLPSITLDEIVVTATRDSCRYGCGDIGIPILPVVFSRDDYRVNGNDKRYFGDGLSSKSAKHDAIASLPTQAYLYYISKRINMYGSSIWSIREVFTGKDGALRYIKTYNENDFRVKGEEDIKADTNKIEVTNIDEPDDELDEMVQPALCEKDEHSTLDSKYITLEPGEVVWLMVSHAKLSKATLKKYFYDAALRNKRMQQFVADELTGNNNTDGISFFSPEIDYINSFHQRKQLEQGGAIDDKITIYEKDGKEGVQGSWRSALQLYKSMERSINDKISDIEDYANKGYEDIEDGKLYKEADQKDLNILKDVKPMMVALHDPVGEVLAAAEKRNYLLSQ
ncbi:toxin VasX, partial [Psychrobacter immobilis]|uniref:toxin VasX n=2 Tax=Psychrobacter TaxID=497 RepID=UPI003FD2A8A7